MSLGPNASFGPILDGLQRYLLRGYQIHVLGFTIHAILEKIVPQLKPGDIDATIGRIAKILLEGIFGKVAEQKVCENSAHMNLKKKNLNYFF